MDPLRIRPATKTDARAVARVHVDTWRTTYRDIVPPEALQSRLSYEKRETLWDGILADPAQFTFVAAEGDQVVGFSNGGRNRGPEPEYAGELYSVYVLDQYQGRGLGRALTLALSEKLIRSSMTSMLVWVLSENPFREFYEELGGKPAGEKLLNVGGADLQEVAYGWPDLRSLLARG